MRAFWMMIVAVGMGFGATHAAQALSPGGRYPRSVREFWSARVIAVPAAPAVSEGNPAGPQTVHLPGKFSDFHIANGGKKLVFHLPHAQQLAVYDTIDGKEIGTIPLSAPDCIFTCGSDAVIVASPSLKILERYSLETLKRTKVAPIPDSRPLRKIKMGDNSYGPAYLYFGGELVEIDGDTLGIVAHKDALPSGNPDWSFDYRISSDGSTMTAWDPYASPSGYSITKFRNDNFKTMGSSDAFSMGNRTFTPTADGSLILYDTHIFDSTGHAVAEAFKDYGSTLATSDRRFFLAIRSDDHGHAVVGLCTANNRQVIATVENLPDIGNGDAGNPRAVLLFENKSLAIVPLSNDRFETMSIPLPDSASKQIGAAPIVISLPPSSVVLTQKYSYQVEVLPEEEAMIYRVESGPTGLNVSATGLVTWTPDKIPEGGKVTAIISATDDAGHEALHSFDIQVSQSE